MLLNCVAVDLHGERSPCVIVAAHVVSFGPSRSATETSVYMTSGKVLSLDSTSENFADALVEALGGAQLCTGPDFGCIHHAEATS